jgi:tight adherence protein B
VRAPGPTLVATGLEEVARHLRSGSSMADAVALAADAVPDPLATQWRGVIDRHRLGSGMATALGEWEATSGLPGADLAVAAMTLGIDVGGARAAGIDSVAGTLRERQNLVAEIHAQGTQARLSALVVSLAPLVFAAFTATADRRTRAALGSPVGIGCLAAGLLLDGAGAWWMSRIAGAARRGWLT